MHSPAAFPEPDYESHPGYGRQFRVGAAQTAKALWTLAPFLLRALAEEVYYNVAVRAWRYASGASSARQALEERGAAAFPDPYERLPAIREELSRLLRADFDSLDLGTQGVRDFPVTREQAPEVFARIDSLLQETGAFAAAGSYLRRRGITYSSLNVKVSGPSSEFKRGFFGDIGEPDPPTRYMHVDSSPAGGMVKAIVYASHVTDRTGPFSYVLGSHRFRDRWLHRLARRAVHKSRVLQRWAPEQRRLFYALPSFLRHKAEVGNDFRSGDARAASLLAAEKRFTSADGAFILFDNAGIHRGGLVDEGRRVILQLILR
jgi:hypothetical protein